METYIQFISWGTKSQTTNNYFSFRWDIEKLDLSIEDGRRWTFYINPKFSDLVKKTDLGDPKTMEFANYPVTVVEDSDSKDSAGDNPDMKYISPYDMKVL